ncbi:MAG: YbjN domain-containing protein [Firmicutes bacterium]|nr:YbjN domain-containing protein [Bacillota bacterium]
MDIKDKIERFMLDMNLSFEEIEENTWMIEDELSHIDNIIVNLSDPILLFRVKIMEIPKENREEFYKKLLELNANDLLHGAYAIENDSVVIVDTLQAENLDMNEFQSTIESIGMALTQHYDLLVKYFN